MPVRSVTRILAAGLSVALATGAAPLGASAGQPLISSSTAVPAHAAPQPLAWTACPALDDPRLECATVHVPLDHARRPPHGRTIDVAISRLPATDPALRRGVLLVTGGGPGEAGVPLPLDVAHLLSPSVLARYDLIGFDLRFLERSTPLSCGQAAEEPGGYWIRSDGYQTFATTVAQAHRYARDCATHAGWALPYATTANAARDMDVIRAALGEPRISFIGGSYAAMLGAVYGTLFPRRVDRFVLDSPVDADRAWRPYDLHRIGAFEENYAAFATWVAARDSEYRLGGTATQVVAALDSALRRAPIVAGDHAWTVGELGYLAVVAVYFEQLWPSVAANLAAIVAGAPPPVPLPIRPAPLPGTPGVPADNHTAVNAAFRCGDASWPRALGDYRRDLAVYGARYPVFGPALANVTPCAFWPVTRDNAVSLTGNSAPAALITAATHDAAVPLANSVATRRAIRGSRLVTVDQRLHAPVMTGQANSCLAGAVDDFLLTGRLPERDLAC